jgi:hypothetical protein
MTLYQYNLLTDHQKTEVIWQGTFLDDRREGRFMVQLYSLGDFYVEVYYNQQNNQIMRFKSFRTTRLLVPYLKKIKI